MSNSDQANKSLLQARALEMESLLEITRAINNNFSEEHLFKIYEFILRAQIRVGRLIVFMKEEDWQIRLQYGVEKKITYQDIETEVFKGGEYLQELNQEVGLKNYEYIVPVFHKKKPLAYVLVGKLKNDSYGNLQSRINFIQTITNIIVVAIENKRLFRKQLQQEALKKELELAAQMQNMLIPSVLPNNEIIQMSSLYLPSKEIGGDYYDAIELRNDKYLFCIADISGKGIPAALLMASFQASINLLAKQHYTLPVMVNILNTCVIDITKGDKFVTAFIGIYNTKSGNLEYVNAGHNPPILYHPNGKQQLLEKGATILGVFDELPKVEVSKVSIEQGSLLVQYTDGLTEQENEAGIFFETQNLEKFIEKHGQEPVEQFNRKLLNRLNEYKGSKPFGDDVTVLSCRFL